jgi:hypothetical protein
MIQNILLQLPSRSSAIKWDALINYHEHYEFFRECFNDRPFELERIFRASDNEWSIAKFHQACDKLGSPTLLVAKSEHQRTFGAYLSIDWDGDDFDDY